MARKLLKGTPIILKHPYNVDGVEFTQGCIHECVGEVRPGLYRYGVTFDGFCNENGPCVADFNSNEFTLG